MNPSAPLPLPLSSGALDAERAWLLLLQLASRSSAGKPLVQTTGFTWAGDNWREAASDDASCVIEVVPDFAPRVRTRAALQANVATMLDLYLPLVLGEGAPQLAVGHLGQSLDGRIATPTGASKFITGQEDVLHTHRMRALFDAVIVGVRTVLADDPQLTTRLAPGPHPTRVILDPHGRLGDACRVFCDGAAPTLVCTEPERVSALTERGRAQVVGIPCDERGFDPAALFAALRARGLRRLFVEGGGVTVSRLLAAGLLDRIQVTVAPMILGSGAPALALPPIDQLDEAMTPRCRHFALGPDVMFDCELPRGPRRCG